MKRLSIFLALSFVLLSFGLANAINFEWYVDPGSLWDNASVLTLSPGSTVDFELKWENNDGKDWTGFSFIQKVYGTGDLTTITWTGGNRTDLTPGISTVNGLWGAGWMQDSMFPFSWDGNLPDTMSHSVLDFGGWLDGDPMTTHYIFHVVLPGGWTAGVEAGEICFDSSGHYDTDRRWLFTGGMDYFGPFCWPVEAPPNFPPEVDAGPQYTTQHDVPFDEYFDITDAEEDVVTAVSANYGTATLVGAQSPWSYQLHWQWDPSCDDVGQSITLELTATDGYATGPVETADIVVNNSAPVIGGDCGGTVKMGKNKTAEADFTVSDDNTGDEEHWSVTSLTPGFDGTYGVAAGVDPHTGLLTVSSGEATGVFDFEVCVTDCNDEESCCTISFEVIDFPEFVIGIEKEEGDDCDVPGVIQGRHAVVNVTKWAGIFGMHGFDFLMAYDASALALMGVVYDPALADLDHMCNNGLDCYPTDADMLFDMGWEYINWRFGPFGNCGNACPSGMVRVIAIADENDGPSGSAVTQVPNGTILFGLDFLVSNDRTLECQFVPINFVWFDCGDNSIAYDDENDMGVCYDPQTDPVHIRQAISIEALGYDGTDQCIWNSPDIVLGHGYSQGFGADSDCLKQSEENECKWNYRKIYFYGGGIDIVCGDEIDARGDVNLNGITYEIADAVTFTNYFLHGLAAFTVNVDGQTAATDANADGMVLSIADLQYLIRVIVGDAMPYPKVVPNATPAKFAQADNLISVDVELGAAAFVLEGNVAVDLADGANNMDLKVAFDGENTRALVYSFDKGASFSGNILNTTGSLVQVEAAAYDGTPMKVVNLPTTFAVKNYPNPFNPATTVSMSLPVASDWKLSIYNVAGQKVDMFKGHAEAGTVDVVWEASNFASGIYFYKFEANNTQITKKMVLLK